VDRSPGRRALSSSKNAMAIVLVLDEVHTAENGTPLHDAANFVRVEAIPLAKQRYEIYLKERS
jgi:hypothetical protein